MVLFIKSGSLRREPLFIKSGSLRREPLFIKSLTHKSTNIDPLYAAQQIVRFPLKEKENVILSRAVHFLQPIVWAESHGAIVL